MPKEDVLTRFFCQKTIFARAEIETRSQVDYVNDLTMVAVVGEFGFGRVVGIGEYLFDPAKNLAEVAFSISKDFQARGLGSILMQKLSQAARENGISGLIAYTAPDNQGMIKLFNTLPYNIKTFFDGEVLSLSCKFDETKT